MQEQLFSVPSLTEEERATAIASIGLSCCRFCEVTIALGTIRNSGNNHQRVLGKLVRDKGSVHKPYETIEVLKGLLLGKKDATMHFIPEELRGAANAILTAAEFGRVVDLDFPDGPLDQKEVRKTFLPPPSGVKHCQFPLLVMVSGEFVPTTDKFLQELNEALGETA